MENKVKFSKPEIMAMLRLALILLAISATVALLLAVVNEVTKGPIAERKIAAVNEAMSAVLPADRYEQIEIESLGLDEIVTDAYAAITGEAVVGYCIKTTPNGYGGAIEMITGVDSEGKVTNVNIVSMSETAGVGTKTKDSTFLSQYVGKGVDVSATTSSTPKENEISAISGATVSSKAVTTGVAAAVSAANAIKGAA